MSRHHRITPPGASHAFTFCLAQRGLTLLTGDVARLRQAYTTFLHKCPVRSDAVVILPDHLHVPLYQS